MRPCYDFVVWSSFKDAIDTKTWGSMPYTFRSLQRLRRLVFKWTSVTVTAEPGRWLQPRQRWPPVVL